MALKGIQKNAVLLLAKLICAISFTSSAARAELNLVPAHAPFVVAQHAEVLFVDVEYIFDPPTNGAFYPLEPALERAAAGEFQPVRTRHIGDGLSNVAAYVRVPVKSLEDAPVEWVLAFNRAANYYFKVHLVLEDQPVPAEPVFEFNFVTDRWDSDDVLIHTEFTMPAQSKGYLYIVFDTLNGGAPMTIETVEGYASKRKSQDLRFFSIVGLTIGLVVITVALMATLRRFVAVYYAGAVLSGLIVVLVSEQYLFALFPNVFWLGDHDTILPYAAVAGPVFALLFQRQFFADVGGTGKVFGKLILAACLFCVVSVIGLMEFEFYPPEFVILGLAICIPLITVNGIIALSRGFAGSWPFFLGAVVFSTSFMVKVLSYEFSSMISSREASLFLLYSLAIEATALSLTMFMQVRHLRFQKEQALKDQVDSAKAKLKMAQSMSHAAHDIQQPLSSLRLALSSNAGRDAKEQDFHQAIDYLESIVKRQLAEVRQETLAHHDDREMPASDVIEPFEMNVVFNNMAVMFSEEAENKGLEFRVVKSSAMVEANVFAVMRVASNLVSNAIRNTKEGAVLVGCRLQAPYVCLDVVDTGNGFSEEELRALREPYVRKGAYQGNGLGLSIVRHLCAEHGFRLDVDSQPNKGSRFRVRLPKA